ncbi:uncharacterized protein LOC110458227 [Mizuhopecten yessoensis]|uniref:Interleukin 17-like protein n=1 Tax=Mizuhopecten yessoensis TaxID=6573 RepID=A0A210Q752_MIZYE|nr:uncharacterized protein LOC110458227 [Mizuhopecten yessoensis]OWF44551.1 Interleukin 17-like protein [Mizuhopecten yessoensis]
MTLLRVLQISLFLTIARGDPLPTRQECREPDDDYLSLMRRSVLEDFVYMSEAHVQIDEVTKQDEQNCPPRSLLSSQNSFSLCPTYQELDRDERRTPSDILQNRCRCERCAMRRRRHHKYICESVYRYIPVIMRVGCTNGIYDYMIAEQKVSVACVCKEKPKSKLGNRTVVSTEQMMEQYGSSDGESISETEKMATNNENAKLLRPELKKMSEVLESLVSVLDSNQNEIDMEEIQEHQRAESSPETEKMPKTFVPIEDAVDTNEDVQDNQPEIPILDTEKMPEIYSSREDIMESAEHNTEEMSPNQRDMTSNPTEKMPQDFQPVNAQPHNAFIPDNQKMPTDFEHIHEHGTHFTSHERMPK